MGEIVTANDATFDSILQKSSSLIVDFWAPSCGPCILMEPGLVQIAGDLENDVLVLKVNVNESPKTSARFLIRTLPTLLFIKNGQVKTQLVGAVSTKQIERVMAETFRG